LEVAAAASTILEPPAPVAQVVAEVMLEVAVLVRAIKAGGVEHSFFLAT
jgi:hypothetical protein